MKKYDELGQSEKAKEMQTEKKEEYIYPSIHHRMVSYFLITVVTSTDTHTFEISGKTLLILF